MPPPAHGSDAARLDTLVAGLRATGADVLAVPGDIISQLAPELYARIMKRRVGGEFPGLV